MVGGMDPAACGLVSESSCGNGSLMRALPTALIRADPDRRRRESEMISAVTHTHRRGGPGHCLGSGWHPGPLEGPA